MLSKRGWFAAAVLVLPACQKAETFPPPLQDVGRPPNNSGSTIGNATPDSGSSLTDAGAVTVLASNISTPSSIALDGPNVFWTDAAGTVSSVPRVGGTVTTLVTALPSPLGLVANGNLYWANAGTGAVASGSIVGLSFSANTLTTFAAGQLQPVGVAADSQFIYWTSQSTSGPGVDVSRVTLAGDGGAPIVVLSNSSMATTDDLAGALVVDSSFTYFLTASTGSGGSLLEAPVGGGLVDSLWDTATGQPSDLMLLSGTLFWLVSAPGGALWSVPAAAGKPVALATGLDTPKHLSATSTTLYWTSTLDGSILALPIPSGATPVTTTVPTTIATGLSAPNALVVDDAIYVTTVNSVVRIPL